MGGRLLKLRTMGGRLLGLSELAGLHVGGFCSLLLSPAPDSLHNGSLHQFPNLTLSWTWLIQVGVSVLLCLSLTANMDLG